MRKILQKSTWRFDAKHSDQLVRRNRIADIG